MASSGVSGTGNPAQASNRLMTLARLLGGGVVDGLDASLVEGSTTAGWLAQVDLHEVVALGIRTELILSSGPWRCDAQGEPGGEFRLSQDGPPEQAFGAPELDAARRAVEDDALQDLLRLDLSMTAQFRFSYSHDPLSASYHWVRGIDPLLELLRGPTRLKVAVRLTGHLPHRVVVEDWGSRVLATGRLVITGPLVASPPEAVPGVDCGPLHGRAPLPRWMLPSADSEGPLASALRRLAFEAAWHGLATRVTERTGEPPLVRFDGARVVELALDADPSLTLEDVDDALALYDWVAVDTGPDRLEAALHAVSLAIANPDDLMSAAVPALRTARSIHRLARRGVVAEALTARRAAREAGMEAGRAASASATEAASKARDRTLLQVLGAAGVVVGGATEALTPALADALLGVLVLVVLVVLAIALLVDIPGAQAALDGFDQDVLLYRETLCSEDIAEIRKMKSIDMAKTQIRKARNSTIVVASLFAAGAVAGMAIGP